MEFRLTEQQFANISMTVLDLDVENSTWIFANRSLSDSPVENSTKPTSMGSSSLVLRYVIACLYWLIFVVGIAGNLLVVSVVIWKLVKSPQYQAMTIFVSSLAVSDLGLPI